MIFSSLGKGFILKIAFKRGFIWRGDMQRLSVAHVLVMIMIFIERILCYVLSLCYEHKIERSIYYTQSDMYLKRV